MGIILSRRSILTGLIAAPLVVRSGLLMPVKSVMGKNMIIPGEIRFYQPEYRTVFWRGDRWVDGEFVVGIDDHS